MDALLVTPAVHTAGVAVVKLTVNPDEDVALTVTGDWANVLLASGLKVISWNQPTAVEPVTVAAAAYFLLPDWLASITQLTAAVKWSVAPSGPDTLQTPAPLVESMENTTGLPDAPPVAERMAKPPTRPEAGAVKLITWEVSEDGVKALDAKVAAQVYKLPLVKPVTSSGLVLPVMEPVVPPLLDVQAAV